MKCYRKMVFRPVPTAFGSFRTKGGLIVWYENHTADTWNHVEAAMALAATGDIENAERAYQWLKDNQHDDGGWWSGYWKGGCKAKDNRETNMTAYVAVGIWHQYRLTRDKDMLNRFWPMVRDAMTFVLNHQSDHGEIQWATEEDGNMADDALVTGCASIFKSLECAIHIAETMGEVSFARTWAHARFRLGDALRNKPHRFDRNWAPKDRFAMDWFYPVLSGAIAGEAANNRLEEGWDKFVIDGYGCRCVSDEPWVTIAETSELVMALIVADRKDEAQEIYDWLHHFRYPGHAHWTGHHVGANHHFPPGERPSYTAAAVLLALDALTETTAAADVLTKHRLMEVPAGLEKTAEKSAERKVG